MFDYAPRNEQHHRPSHIRCCRTRKRTSRDRFTESASRHSKVEPTRTRYELRLYTLRWQCGGGDAITGIMHRGERRIAPHVSGASSASGAVTAGTPTSTELPDEDRRGGDLFIRDPVDALPMRESQVAVISKDSHPKTNRSFFERIEKRTSSLEWRTSVDSGMPSRSPT